MAAGTYYATIASQTLPELITSYTLSLGVLAYPTAPTDLSATAGEGTIVLNWSAVTPATGYIIYYQYSAEAPFETTSATEGASPLSTTEVTFTLSGMPQDAPTFACVSTLNGTAESACSELVLSLIHI